MKWLGIALLLILPEVTRAGTLPVMVRVGTFEMHPWVDEGAADLGIISRIVTRAFGQLRLQTQFEWMPWKRLFHPIHSKSLDVVFPISFNEERAKTFLYSDELVQLDRVACHLKDAPFVWDKPEDFKGKTIAFRRGAYFGSLYAYLDKHKIANFVESDSNLSMLKMLLARRVDLVFCQPREIKLSLQNYVAEGLLEPGEMDQISMKGKPILTAPLFVGFPRHNALGQDSIVSLQLRERFNRSLARLKKNEPELFRFQQY